MDHNSSGSITPKENEIADIARFFKSPDYFPAPLKIKPGIGKHDTDQVKTQRSLPSTNARVAEKKKAPKPPLEQTPLSSRNIPKDVFSAPALIKGHTVEDENEDDKGSTSSTTKLNRLSGSPPPNFDGMEEYPSTTTVELRTKKATIDDSVVEDKMKVPTEDQYPSNISKEIKLPLKETNLALADKLNEQGFSKDETNPQITRTITYNRVIGEISQMNDGHKHRTITSHCNDMTVNRKNRKKPPVPPPIFSKKVHDHIEQANAAMNMDDYANVKGILTAQESFGSPGTPGYLPAPLKINPKIAKHDIHQVKTQPSLPSTNASARPMEKPPKPPLEQPPLGSRNIPKVTLNASALHRSHSVEYENEKLKESTNSTTKLNRLSGSPPPNFDWMDEYSMTTVELRTKKATINNSVIEDKIKVPREDHYPSNINKAIRLPLEEANLALPDNLDKQGFSKGKANPQITTTTIQNRVISEISQMHDGHENTMNTSHCNDMTVNTIKKPPVTDCFPATLKIKSSIRKQDTDQVKVQRRLPSTNASARPMEKPPKPPLEHPPLGNRNIPKDRFSALALHTGHTVEDENEGFKESTSSTTKLNRLSGRSPPPNFDWLDEYPNMTTVDLRRNKSIINSSIVEDKIKVVIQDHYPSNISKAIRLPLEETNVALGDHLDKQGFSKGKTNPQITTTPIHSRVISEISQMNDEHENTTNTSYCNDMTVNTSRMPPVLRYHSSDPYEYPEYDSIAHSEENTTEFIRISSLVSPNQEKTQLQALKPDKLVINRNPNSPTLPPTSTDRVYLNSSRSKVVDPLDFYDIGKIHNAVTSDSQKKIKNLDVATKELSEMTNKVDYTTYDKPILAVKPTPVGKKTIFNNSDIDPELAFIMKDLLDTELDYIADIAKGLKIRSKLIDAGVQQLSCYKFFGLLDNLYSFHNEILIKELQSNSNKPKYFVLCFIKQNIKFNIYIERQWIIPGESDLTDLEFYTVKNHDLESFFLCTSKRLHEYSEFLEIFKSICQKTNNLECQVAADSAIEIMRRLQNQIDKVNYFKHNFPRSRDKFHRCGRFLLEGTFKVSLNGGPNVDSIIYVFENLVVFAQNKSGLRYIDSIPTLKMYCRESKKERKLEIGINGQKRFKLTAESQQVKLLWCNKFKEINSKSYEKD